MYKEFEPREIKMVDNNLLSASLNSFFNDDVVYIRLSTEEERKQAEEQGGKKYGCKMYSILDTEGDVLAICEKSKTAFSVAIDNDRIPVWAH